MTKELKVEIQSKQYSVDGSSLLVLEKLSFEVAEGEHFSLIGPSGCGKTTLLRIIAGLDLEFRGRVTVGGKPIYGPGRERGLVFQESRLLPWLTVEGNIAFALATDLPDRERRERVRRVLVMMNLTAFARALPSQLSGGMAKRVALARALVNGPDTLLFDEPFSGLDLFTKLALQDEIIKLVRRTGVTMLMVTHDLDEALALSDKIALLSHRPARVCALYTVPSRDRAEGSSELRSEIYSQLQIITREVER
jgi:sulfonate transport system ATP-binding protein